MFLGKKEAKKKKNKQENKRKTNHRSIIWKVVIGALYRKLDRVFSGTLTKMPSSKKLKILSSSSSNTDFPSVFPNTAPESPNSTSSAKSFFGLSNSKRKDNEFETDLDKVRVNASVEPVTDKLQAASSLRWLCSTEWEELRQQWVDWLQFLSTVCNLQRTVRRKDVKKREEAQKVYQLIRGGIWGNEAIARIT
jgi:hypothetical protein